MISTISSFLVLVTLAAVYSNPVESDVELFEHAAVRADPTTVIYDNNLPTDGALQLLGTIRDVHGSYFSNKLKAKAISGGFNYRSVYCAWNVVIYPNPATPPTNPDDLGAIFIGVPKSGYTLTLVNNTLFYYVFSSPQPSRICEF